MFDPTYLTARLAMLLYAASLLARLLSRRPTATARLFYTAGCLLLLVHVAVAFHVHHHWSHAAARAHVEEATARYTGVVSGLGLWLNYLAAVVWGGDVIYWWIAGTRRYAARPRFVSVTIQAFLIFMAVNAAVVFAQKTMPRVIGGAICVALLILWIARMCRGTKTMPGRDEFRVFG